MAFGRVAEDLSSNAVTLITGPPMTGKYQLLFRVVARARDGVIFITTKNGAARVIDDYRSIGDGLPPDRIGIVDCVGDQWAPDDAEVDGLVRRVNGPAALTSIGVQFTDLSAALRDDPEGESIGVGLHSISQLVMNADLERVYKFLQVLTGQIRTAGWFGAAVVDVSPTDAGETSILQHHFDNVLETRENEDGAREFRVKGRTSTAGWEAY